MSKIIPIFLFAWICLSLAGYLLYIDSVESDLHARSKEVLSSAGYEWLDISQQGRDLTLHGNAPDEDSITSVMKMVSSVYGVRIVQTGDLSLALPEQALLEKKGIDRDNDGVIDTDDAFPLDSSETVDTDNDGIGDNADADDNNDGYSDSIDDLMLKLSENKDSDGDGIADNSDSDDDNDGIKDSLDAFPYVHADISDMDGDGVSDSQDTYPNDSSRWSDNQLEVSSIEVSSIDNNQIAFNPCSVDIDSITSHTMIYFQSGSSIVDNEGIALLTKLAAFLNNCPFYFVNVTGHTDLRGNQAMNQQLSEQRAANVKAQLVDLGVNHQRIESIGVAASSPVSDNTSIDGFAGNRRVEIALTQ